MTGSRGRRPGSLRSLCTAALALALVCAGALTTTSAAAAPHDQPRRDHTAAAPAAKASDATLRERLRNGADRAAARNQRDRGAPSADPFIIGGVETPISSAPWMVQLGYFDEATNEGYFCGGTLVAPSKVLTAAHCVAGLNWTANGAVIAGTATLDDTTTGTVAGVYAQWNHPKYSPDTLRSDIAVLTLDRPLEQPWLPLAASNDSALYTPGTNGVVYGWGLTSGTGTDLSAQLRRAKLPMVSDTTCNAAMNTVLGQDLFAEGSMVCAGTPAGGSDTGTISPCNGDSGGPLVVNGKIAGIVSWGVNGCTAQGAYPVFTKVSSFVWAAQPRVDNADLTYDGRADLLGRTPYGNLYQYESRGRSFAARKFVGGDWDTITLGIQADLDRDWYQDWIVREKSDGALWRSYMSHSTWEWTWAKITTVWGGYSSYAIPGDMTGDARPDLVAVDKDGNTYLYPGRGNGQFNGKIKIVSGAWKGVKVFGHGDLSGDGKPDLLVRDKSNVLWLYRGTGRASAPWSARIKARTGWNFTALVSTGDVTDDGISDVLARQSNGTLWLYPGTNKASADLFSSRVRIGSGWNQYNLLF